MLYLAKKQACRWGVGQPTFKRQQLMSRAWPESLSPAALPCPERVFCSPHGLTCCALGPAKVFHQSTSIAQQPICDDCSCSIWTVGRSSSGSSTGGTGGGHAHTALLACPAPGAQDPAALPLRPLPAHLVGAPQLHFPTTVAVWQAAKGKRHSRKHLLSS